MICSICLSAIWIKRIRTSCKVSSPMSNPELKALNSPKNSYSIKCSIMRRTIELKLKLRKSKSFGLHRVRRLRPSLRRMIPIWRPPSSPMMTLKWRKLLVKELRRRWRNRGQSRNACWRCRMLTLMILKRRKWLRKRFVRSWLKVIMSKLWRTVPSSLGKSLCFTLKPKLMEYLCRHSLTLELRALLFLKNVRLAATLCIF